MNVVGDFPHEAHEVPHLWISLASGSRLGARLWLPAAAATAGTTTLRVPALLEYLPYRKNDGTAIHDPVMHRYFAGHGIASLRVDMRGSGESDGVLDDEYSEQELADGEQLIAWVAAQPWCNGRVGVFGISWGGFNALQLAARRPPALKAIISACATDDRYATDVHYMGGSVLAYDMLPWASTLQAMCARPPDPHYFEQRDVANADDEAPPSATDTSAPSAAWLALWKQRLQESPHVVATWLAHQRRDSYWQHGSVCEDYDAIACPVLAVGGWADAYSDGAFRLWRNLPVDSEVIIGSWAHNWPHQGSPGPQVGFLQEALAFWQRHLLAANDGEHAPLPSRDGARLRAYIQEFALGDALIERPGQWVECSKESHPQRWYLGSAQLRDAPATGERVDLPWTLAHGRDAATWCPFSGADLPGDQQTEDGCCQVFNSPPVTEPQVLLGMPRVSVTLCVDQPNAQLVARLCDVAPDGRSQLVSRGVLNLCRRDGHDRTSPLEPGRQYHVQLPLSACGHRLAAGHHWRLALSPCYWPWIWPSPQPVRLTVVLDAGSFIELPVLHASAMPLSLPFAVAEGAAPLRVEVLSKGASSKSWQVGGYGSALTVSGDSARIRFASGIETCSSRLDEYTLDDRDPRSASVHCSRTFEYQRGDWRTRVAVRASMRCEASCFVIHTELSAHLNDKQVAIKHWDDALPRDGN